MLSMISNIRKNHNFKKPKCNIHPIIRVKILALLILSLVVPASAQIDPLGRKVFNKSGKELYRINTTYGIFEGDSAIWRSKEFEKRTGKRNYFTFDIPGDNVLHQLTIGSFPTKFSSLTLNKQLFDAVRWNITVPRSRGRISTFLARLTNNTFARTGEGAYKPIQDTEIRSNADWFMTGIRAEANLGAYAVKFATLPEFTLPLPRVGISYTNRFFTNYDMTRTSNPFRGVVASNPPSEVYLRFGDDSPENPGGAKVFHVKVYIDEQLEYDFVGGREPTGVLMAPNLSYHDDASRWVDEEAKFVYRFALSNPQDVESVRFELDIANDYLVELSTDGSKYQVQFASHGNVTDESNRRLEKFHYGELTDEATMGIDIQTTLWGIAIEAERSWFMQTVQYPLFHGKRTNRTASAWFVDANRSFGPLTWRSEYTYIDPFYNAGNFVDDNDNDDPYADSREPEELIAGSDSDRDGDRINDWHDDFLLFDADPPKFRLGLDREWADFNNNGQPDKLEDDSAPNYREDYEEGSYGHHTYFQLDIPFVSGLSIVPGYYEKRLIQHQKSARGLYNIFIYSPPPIQNWSILFRHTFRRSQDIIPDDWISGGRLYEDDLSLQNYLGNIFTMKAEYKNNNIPGLTIRSKFKYQYDVLFHTKERIIDTMLINQFRYEYNIRPDLSIAPAFRNDRSIGYSIPHSEGKTVDFIRNAYIVTLTHQVIEQLELSAGMQYLTWRDNFNQTNNFDRTTAFMELVIQGSAFGARMGLLISAGYTIQNYVEPVGGGEKNTNISATLFVL